MFGLYVHKKSFKKCLRFFNKETPLYAGLSSKQKKFEQLPSNLSERTLFEKSGIFFHRVNI